MGWMGERRKINIHPCNSVAGVYIEYASPNTEHLGFWNTTSEFL